MTKHKEKYVIDTNVLISCLLVLDSVPSRAVKYVLNNGVLLLSDNIIEEIDKILSRSKFDKYVSVEARKLFLEGLTIIGQKVEITKHVYICRDQKDNYILEAALSGKADAMITGDQDLLLIKSYNNIDILSPADFIKKTDI